MTYCQSTSDVNVMKELRHAIYGLRNCILVAGAGLSAQAVTKEGKHPPLWSGLLNGMIEWCIRNRLMEANDAKELEALIRHGYLIEAGQEVEDTLREKSWQQQCVREVLLCNDAAFSLAHEHITRIPFRAFLDELRHADRSRVFEDNAETPCSLLRAFNRQHPGGIS